MKMPEMPDMSEWVNDPEIKERKESFRFWLSIIISVIALIVAALSLYLQVREQQKQDRTPPTSQPVVPSDSK